jgi:hypothetical protein
MLAEGYDESKYSYRATLLNLTGAEGGTMDGRAALAAIRKRRDQVGADLVTLVREGRSRCGQAWRVQPFKENAARYAYSQVSRQCLADSAMARFFGHNMGLHRDHYVEKEPGSYNFGFVTLRDRARDVMSSNQACKERGLTCHRRNLFSNPRILVDGHPFGVRAGQKNAADASRYLNEVRARVAGFRRSVRQSSWTPVYGNTTYHGASYDVHSALKRYSVMRSEDVFRFNLQPGEQWAWDRSAGNSNERAELCALWQLTPGTVYEIAFDMIVEATAPSASDWVFLGQLHATEDKGDNYAPPVLGQVIYGDRFQIETRTSREDPLKSPPTQTVQHVSAFKRGLWHSYRYRIKVDPNGGAMLHAWIDGTQVLKLDNASIGYVDEKGPYWKFGVYRAAARDALTVSYRNMMIRVEEPAPMSLVSLPATASSHN